MDTNDNKTPPNVSSAPMTREEFMAKLAANPRFREVKTFDGADGFIIVGAKPSK